MGLQGEAAQQYYLAQACCPEERGVAQIARVPEILEFVPGCGYRVLEQVFF